MLFGLVKKVIAYSFSFTFKKATDKGSASGMCCGDSILHLVHLERLRIRDLRGGVW